MMTEKDVWLHQNREYVESFERMVEASNTLFEFDEETAEEHARLAAKYKAAHLALMELREQLIAAHSAEEKK